MWCSHAELTRSRELLGAYAGGSRSGQDRGASIRGILATLKSKSGSANRFSQIEAFERDYPAFLLALASGIRTGLDPLSALCGCELLFADDSRIKRELRMVAQMIQRGDSEEEAIRKFASEIAHPDIELFRTAFIFARKHGASLADTLRRLARVTRQRQSFRRKMRAAVAMQRVSALGISVCTMVIAMIQVLGNPEALRIAWHNPVGMQALGAGAFLVLVGFLWMLTLTRTQI